MRLISRSRLTQPHGFLLTLTIALTGCGKGEPPFAVTFAPGTPVFSHPTEITNRYLPLSELTRDLLLGMEGGDSVRVIRTRPGTTRTFTVDGKQVETMVVIDSEFVAGVLEEVTSDYFAQADDGTVYYFGEDVDVLKNGVVVNHEGAWLYGVHTQTLGVLVPGNPAIGQTFRSEDVVGITQEDDEVVSLTESVTVPAGSYTNCLRIKEMSQGGVEYKYYAPGVGVIDEVPGGGRVSLATHN